MPDISDFLPKESKTVTAIYAHYKKEGDTGHMSRTLSVSLLGRPCERYLWYCFRQCCKPEFDGRMYRLFETGHLEEARLTANLRAIGCIVHDIDERRAFERTSQFLILGLGGHLKGYMDGCALGIPEAPKTWHVLEYKTHNAKSFRKLTRGGVEKTKPEHYAQVMIEMHLTGMRRALYLAINKDTDEIYSERIRYDKTEAETLHEKARRIISASSPPARISGRPDYYLCGWCDARKLCHGTDAIALPIPELSCRQCCHATPVIEGEGAWWKCDSFECLVSQENMQCSCDRHLTLPGLLPFAESTDYGQTEDGHDFIEFTNEDGTKWGHGNAAGCYSSAELMKLPANVLTNEFLHGATKLFGATATGHQMGILQRYPEEDSRLIWKGHKNDLISAWKSQYNDDLAALTPIARCNFPEYAATEYGGGRVAVAWKAARGLLQHTAEIREGVE